jgi:hypothetical protein
VRVTFDARSGDSPFHATGRVYSLQNNNDGVPFPVPEPTTGLTTLAIFGIGALRRRTRRLT